MSKLACQTNISSLIIPHFWLN